MRGASRVIKQELAAKGFSTALGRHSLILRSSYITFIKIQAPTNGRLTLSWGEEGLVALQRANATAPRSSNLCSAVEGHRCDGLGGRPSLFGELTSRRLDAHTWNAPPFAHHWPTLRKSKVNMVKQWPPDQQIIFIQYARGKDAAINDRLRSQRAGARVVVRPYTHQVDKGGFGLWPRSFLAGR